ncbi:MAG: AMP-binding protein [Akkermansiaceae bacterium]|jgi:O-succinylbenzoic acid--CoA ligase|nr:AMP-binding protein [Akkermansiaceae bacterium]
MNALLLIDPAFWQDEKPFAPAGWDGGWPELPDLAGMVLFATSGSGGAPKMLALSKSALLLSAAAVNCHLGVDAESCWGLALPWHHVGGFGVIARAFEAACRLARFELRWDAAAFRDWLARESVTHVSLVPTQVHDLVAAKLGAPPALRAVVVGGGRLDAATGRAARALGWPVLASYGMTEAGSQIATQGLEALAASYQPAPLAILPIWDTRLGADGRLEISGPALFAGTLVSAGCGWRFVRREGAWHTTADRVALAGGELTPLGRVDAAVKVLGELVDPGMVEQELLDCGEGRLRPGSFVVLAEPDVRAGHRLVPVFEDAVPAALVEATLAGYHARVPGFRRLQPPRRVAAIPRSPLGKVRRHLLPPGNPEP